MKSCDVISLIWFEYTGYSGLDNLKLRATPCSHHRTVIIMPTDILGAKAKAGTSMAGESASDRVNATVPRSYCQMLDRWVAAHAVLCCLTSNDGSKGCYNLPQIVTLLQVCPGLEQTQFHFEHGEPCCSLSLSLLHPWTHSHVVIGCLGAKFLGAMARADISRNPFGRNDLRYPLTAIMAFPCAPAPSQQTIWFTTSSEHFLQLTDPKWFSQLLVVASSSAVSPILPPVGLFYRVQKIMWNDVWKSMNKSIRIGQDSGKVSEIS